MGRYGRSWRSKCLKNRLGKSEGKNPQIIHVMHWHVWTSWSFQLNVASQGYLVPRVWLQRVAGGEACRILLSLYLVVDLGLPSLSAVRKKRWTWWVKSKGKLEATGPSSSIFYRLITKTLKWQFTSGF